MIALAAVNGPVIALLAALVAIGTYYALKNSPEGPKR